MFFKCLKILSSKILREKPRRGLLKHGGIVLTEWIDNFREGETPKDVMQFFNEVFSRCSSNHLDYSNIFSRRLHHNIYYRSYIINFIGQLFSERLISFTRIVGGQWRHEFAIYGYKLTVHFHIWWFCDVTVRLLFVCGY